MKEKTNIYELGLHETIKITTNLGLVEVTRVPGGFVYAFEYPGWRQSHIVFVPFNSEFLLELKKTSKKK